MLSIPIYKIFVDDTVEGIQKISLVHSPAVESNFLAFSEETKDTKPFKFEADEDEHIVFGCALRANYPIYRRDDVRGEYYVVFSEDAIKDIVEKFAKNGNFNNVNLNHETDTDCVYLTQMFYKDVDKGINPIGFEDIEDKSLFTAYKIENDAVWQNVKDGTFQGLSVEGIFRLAEVEAEQSVAAEKQQPEEQDEIDQLVDEILK